MHAWSSCRRLHHWLHTLTLCHVEATGDMREGAVILRERADLGEGQVTCVGGMYALILSFELARKSSLLSSHLF